MDDYLPFQGIFVFFKKSIPNGISLTNRHMFILDGHGSHVTLEAIKQAQEFGLDMIILFSHTSHALQVLDVASFKLFKKKSERKETQQWLVEITLN
jgi:translation initiation factor IF-3